MAYINGNEVLDAIFVRDIDRIADGAVTIETLADNLRNLILEDNAIKQINKSSDGVSEYLIDGSSTNINSTGSVSESTTYKTFVFSISANVDIYFSTPTNYTALCIYNNNEVDQSNFVSPRRRYVVNGENTLPYENSPLSVTAGQLLAITVNKTGDFELNISGDAELSINTDAINDNSLNGAKLINNSVSTNKLAANVEQYLKKALSRTRMEFGAHRGVEYYAPQNSVPAYKMAGVQGWEWAWIAQVKYSADGTLYVMHNNTVDETTDGTGTMSELTDAYINSLHIDYAPSNAGYDIDDFNQNELYVPTLDEIVSICVRYGMKMCFRLGTMPATLDSDTLGLWDKFEAIIKKYNIPMSDCCFSGIPQQVKICVDKFGADTEFSCYISPTATAQDYVNWFNDPLKQTGAVKKSAIINTNVLDAAGVELLHKNGIKVYAYTNAYVIPTNELVKTLANWGVELYQNSSVYFIS